MNFKRILKITLLVLLVGFVVIQLKQPDRTNAAENASDTMETRLSVPPPVKAIIDRSCADCHTNRTRWPFYSYVAPVSWQVADHVREGQSKLNMSLWGTYEPRVQRRKLHEMCSQVKGGEMPISQYTLVHRDAVLSAQDVETLCGWTTAEETKLKARLDAQAPASPAPAETPAK